MKGRKRTRRPPRVRPLPAFQDLRGEIGRAAESGGTIHIALGSGGLVGEDAVTSLAAIEAVEELADTAVLYNAPPIITVGDPTLLPLAQDALRQAYERHGLGQRYDPRQVRFVAPSPIAYAATAANVVTGEDVLTNVMIGDFGPEVSLIADAGMRHDLPQMGIAAAPDAVAALYPATDHVAAGEELYAAGSQITNRTRYWFSVWLQDWIRVLFLVPIILLWALVKLLSSF